VLSCVENFDELFQDADKKFTAYPKSQMKKMTGDCKRREAVYGHIGDGKQADKPIEKISKLVK